MNHNVEEKSELRNFVLDLISQKIEKLEKFIDFTVEATKDIKKTPKYDTIREEAQEEIYQLDKQMFELKNMQRAMRKVLNSKVEFAQTGAVVMTDKARFYISVSLGEFFYKGDRFYAISPESPMAKKMNGLKAGDEFILNKIHQKIVEIF